MLSDDVLADDAEFEECADDIRAEVATFGEVSKFAFPRPSDLQGYTEADVGSCFARFALVSDAVKAQAALGGREFDGQRVVAAFVPE